MKNEDVVRAKQIDDGEWITGHLICSHGLFFIFSEAECEEDGLGRFIQIDADTICHCIVPSEDPHLQIWENDIVRLNGMCYLCCWNECTLGWSLRSKLGCLELTELLCKNLKVVGSRFDMEMGSCPACGKPMDIEHNLGSPED